MAAEHILHMQKSLSLMNVQIHHVLSDITGLSGLAILDAVPLRKLEEQQNGPMRATKRRCRTSC
jgi:transposase